MTSSPYTVFHNNRKVNTMSSVKSLANEKVIVLTIGIAMLMEFIDISVLNTSLPQIAFSLQVNPIDLKVALTVYLLALGAFIPAAGWVSSKMGVRRVLLIAITGFLLSSIACGLSANLIMLTISRGAQGIFGAFISPVARLMLVQLFKSRLAEVMAKIVPIFLLGPLLGPLIGGAITTQLNWRFIFFVNVPVGAFVIAMVYWLFPTAKNTASPAFDIRGFLFLAFALASALLTIDTLSLPALSLFYKVLFATISLVLFAGYYHHYRNSKNPLLNLTVFRCASYSYFSFLIVMVRLFSMNMGFIAPLYVQTHYHYSAWQSGLMVAPIVLGALIGKKTLPWLQIRLSIRMLLSLFLSAAIVVLIALGYSMLHFHVAIFVALLLLNGWCIGQLMPICTQFIYRDLNPSLAATGSVINSAIMQLTQGFAIAIIAGILMLTSTHVILTANTPLPDTSYAMVLFVNAGMILLTLISVYWMRSTAK